MKKEELSQVRKKIEEIVRSTLDKAEKIEYVDVHGNLDRVNLFSDLIIFGRRGSGKTTLLIQSKKTAKNIFPIYIQCETYKEHTYPNLLLSILAQIIKQSLQYFRWYQKIIKYSLYNELKRAYKELKILIQQPDEMDVGEEKQMIEKAKGKMSMGNTGFSAEKSSGIKQNYQYKQKKIDYLTNNLDEFQDLFSKIIKSFSIENIFVYFDDFYHLDFESQPNIIDYIFRLSKDLKISFKIATIRHRSHLYSRNENKEIRGVQSNADHTSIDLDFSLENFDSTTKFLKEILKNIFKDTKISFDDFFNLFVQNGFERVVWASGGVPRDFMILIMYIIDSLDFDSTNLKIDKKIINSAAKELFREKEQDLNSNYAHANNVKQFYDDVFTFCVKYNKKTGFLLRQPCTDKKIEEQVKNLMDHRLIHPIVKNMTLNKFRGTFAAYILDVGSYQPFLNIRIEDEKIKELDILRKDMHKKTELVEFRALSLKQELTSENISKSKQFVETEKNKIKKTKRNDEYARMMTQQSLFN